MRLQHTMSVWKIMIIGMAGLLSGCGLPDAPRASSPADAPLLLAQSRWQAGHPMRYRLVVQEDTDQRSCRQSVEVHDEQVEIVLEDHCGRATPWTVSGLLDWLSYRARAGSACSTASLACMCQVHHSARAVYDPKLGYPYSATYQWTLAPNWANLRPLQQLFGARVIPDCANSAGATDGTITIRVVSLTALP
ncbi:MAG: hypothetical protein ABIV47_16980 [Roseiflexaceae bacterium]